MAEEVCAFVRFELLQGIGGGSLESVEGSRGGLAHMRLELGKGIFDRIEIGAVGRQIVEFGAAGLNGKPDARDLVGGQIVHNDDIAWAQYGNQHLLDPGQEALSVHRTVQKHRCNKARKRESAHKSDGFPMTVRNAAFPSKIQFSVCGNTKEGMEKKEGQPITVLSEAVVVPSGVVRLMELQEKGWSYVRP